MRREGSLLCYFVWEYSLGYVTVMMTKVLEFSFFWN